jgi:hypothetical protein
MESALPRHPHNHHGSCIRRGFAATLVMGAALLLGGCANAPRFNTVNASNAPIQLTSVYIYSFLDVRESLIGKNMLQELETQLGERFERNGVKVEQLWFSRSPLRREVSLNEEPARSGSIYTSSSTMRVPVAETIRSNASAEVAFSPRYRLTVFPALSRATGAGTGYKIYWDLFDVTTNKLVWRSDSDVHNLNMWKSDEMPKERAKAIVDGIFKEFAKSGLKCRADCV